MMINRAYYPSMMAGRDQLGTGHSLRLDHRGGLLPVHSVLRGERIRSRTASAMALRGRVPRAGDAGLFVGVDVGGTKVAAGLVDANGEILSHVRVPMISHASAEDGLSAVLQAIAQVSAWATRRLLESEFARPARLIPRLASS